MTVLVTPTRAEPRCRDHGPVSAEGTSTVLHRDGGET